MASKTVLISGATSGIGADCATTLLASGFEVIGGFRKKSDGPKLRKAGIVPVPLDVTRPKSIASAAEFVRRRCGKRGLFGLVNNAGVSLVAPLELAPIARVRGLFEVNVLGVVALTQAMLPALRVAQGRIVNVSSMSGLLTAPFLSAYCASKAALESLSDALRMEVAPWGIEVCLIEPGQTASRVWEKSGASAKALRSAAPAASRALYEAAWDRMDEVIRKAGVAAESTGRVTEAVLDALTNAQPATRYTLDHGQSQGLRALPDRERDAKLLQGFGLPGRP